MRKTFRQLYNIVLASVLLLSSLVGGFTGLNKAFASTPTGPNQYVLSQQFGSIQTGDQAVATMPQIVDVNGDGRPDLVGLEISNLATRQYATVRLATNTQGVYASPVRLQIPGAYTIKVANFTGDDSLDIISTANRSHPNNNGIIDTIEIHQGNADGTFQDTPSWSAPVPDTSTLVSAMYAKDINNDGKSDAVITFTDNTMMTVLSSATQHTTQLTSINNVGGYPGSQGDMVTAVTDLNGDGKMDLLVSFNNGDGVVWTGDGLGNFSPTTSLISGAGYSFTATPAVGDFNGDGKVDIAVGYRDASSSPLRVRLGDGQGHFGVSFVGSERMNVPVGLYAADVNRDGKDDLLAWNNQEVSVYLSTGGGYFASTQVLLIAETNYTVTGGLALGDANVDGLTDVLTGGTVNSTNKFGKYTLLTNVNTTAAPMSGNLLFTEGNPNGGSSTLASLNVNSDAITGIHARYTGYPYLNNPEVNNARNRVYAGVPGGGDATWEFVASQSNNIDADLAYRNCTSGSVSPDDSTFACATYVAGAYDIKLINLATRAFTTFSVPGSLASPKLDWLSGNSLVISVRPSSMPTCNTSVIASINTDGTGLTPLTGCITNSTPRWPKVSHDRTKITFQDGNDTSIWTMGVDGSNKRKILQGEVSIYPRHIYDSPSWSWDGNYLAAIDTIMNADSSRTTNLVVFSAADGNIIKRIPQKFGQPYTGVVWSGTYTPTIVAPANLTISSGTSVPVDLNWGAVAGATSYNVYRNGVKIASTNAANANYSDRGAQTGLNTYYVTTVNANGESAPSNSVSVTLPTQYYVSGNISINNLPLPSSNYSNVSFTLKDNGNTPRTSVSLVGVSNYSLNVTQLTQARNYGMDIQYADAQARFVNTQTNQPDQFLLKQTTYPIFLFNNNVTQNYDFTTKRVNVLVKNAQGNPVSSQVNVTNVGNSTIPNNVDQTLFTVAGGYEHSTNYTDGTTGQTSFALFPGGNFNICATAINICQNFTLADDMSIVLSPLPGSPANLAAQSPTQAPVSLSWSSVSGATSYNVYRNGIKVGSSAVTSYSDATAPLGTNTYFVKAVNNSGEGTSSNTIVVEVVPNQAPAINPLSGATLGVGGSYAENGTFTDLDSTSWVATVNYGDGSGVQTLPLAGFGFSLGHIYNAEGTYTVTVSVTDNQGTVGTTTSTVVVSDVTAPTVTGTPDRNADNATWYNHDVTISWVATDPDSSATTPDATVVSTDGENQTVTSGQSCDPSANCATGTYSVSLDKTAPTIDPSLSQQPNAAGWNNGPVTVTFNCSDATSGVDTCTPPVTVTAEGGTIVTGTAVDKAGNTTSVNVFVMIDSTRPTITFTAASNGWVNTPTGVPYQCTNDDGSVSNYIAPVVTGPDGQTTATGTCVDRAGNTVDQVIPVNVDTAQPEITPVLSQPTNSLGWSTGPVTVTFQCDDPGIINTASGIDTCSDPVTVTQEGTTIVTGTAIDRAGNTNQVNVFVSIDSTKPTIDYTVTPATTTNGWSTGDVTVTFTCADNANANQSGLASCSGPVTVSVDGLQQVTGTAVDVAGNVQTVTVPISLDKTAPNIDFTLSQQPNSAGWNNSPVTVTFNCNDVTSGVDTCTAPVTVSSEGGTIVTGTAVDRAGNTSSVNAFISLDTSLPSIIAVNSPLANANDWYNSDVTTTFTCLDAVSDILNCPSPVTTNTEAANQVVGGTTIDNAGNTNSATTTINLDKTAPNLEFTLSQQPNSQGWNNGPVTVTFNCSDATSGVDTCTSPVTVTAEGGTIVTGTAIDKAGNITSVNVIVLIDLTQPSITHTIAPTPNAGGWNNTDTTVSFNCTDSLSLILSCISSHPGIFDTDGIFTVTGTATDNAGNTSSDTATVKIDKTAPVLAVQPIWTNNPKSTTSTATLTIPVTENLSGISKAEYYIGYTDPGQGNGATMTLTGQQTNAQGAVISANLTTSFGTDFQPGVYNIVVRAMDNAGNWSFVNNSYLVVGSKNVNASKKVSPKVTAGDKLPGLITDSQNGQADLGFEVFYTNGGTVDPSSHLSLDYLSEQRCHNLNATGCYRTNFTATTSSPNSISSLIISGSSSQFGSFRGQGTLTINGVATTNPFKVQLTDGNNVLPTINDDATLYIYASGANPDTATELYRLRINANGNWAKIL